MTDLEGLGAGSAPAVSVCAALPPPWIEILRKRADFLRAAAALRLAANGFLLQARARGPLEAADVVRVGFTCSKKVGNAVARNRAKRRLREIVRLELPALARPGWDYVLIGRPGVTIERDFAALRADLKRALAEIHSGRVRPSPPRDAPKGRRGKG